jgi:hypothetical protein
MCCVTCQVMQPRAVPVGNRGKGPAAVAQATDNTKTRKALAQVLQHTTDAGATDKLGPLVASSSRLPLAA